MSCDCPYCNKEGIQDFLNGFQKQMSQMAQEVKKDELEEEISHEVDGEEILSQLVDHYQLPYYISRAIELLCSDDKEDWEQSQLFIQLQMDKD